MPRAKRNFLPDFVWHITVRCVNKEFLLRFKHDRRRWLYWMYKAKQRFNFSLLNYTVTSNHIHCVMMNNGRTNHIAKSMHLASSRTAQEFNERKNRQGSFWGDRYHATAVETGEHLKNCLIYIDMNMVRAGAVSHPMEWHECGYQEISGRKKRYRLIDIEKLCSLLGSSPENISRDYEQSLSLYLVTRDLNRDKKWTESIAVGSESFVENFKERLGIKARNFTVVNEKDSFILKEDRNPYGGYFRGKNCI